MLGLKRVAIAASAATFLLAACNGGGSGPMAPDPDHDFAPPAELGFSKHPEPVWRGNLLAGDPAILRREDRLLLYYTDLLIAGDGDGDNPDNLQVFIGVAESMNGVDWTFANPDVEGSVALLNAPDSWDRVLETAFVIKHEDAFLMYYTGYEEGVDGVETIVADGRIGVARSTDGVNFSRFVDPPGPVLATDTEQDSDALFSPSAVFHAGMFYMVYTGWALERHGYGLFAAVSSDGRHWEKFDRLLIEEADVPWSIDNPREAELVAGPDGLFYLFFTSDEAAGTSAIGVARASDPMGPWEVHPERILFGTRPWEPSGVLAPAVLIEEDRVRIWYMAEIDDFSEFYIGYAELDFPFAW